MEFALRKRLRIFEQSQERQCRMRKKHTDLFLRSLRRAHGLCVKFEAAESILPYRSIGLGIEEIDQHELFRVPR